MRSIALVALTGHIWITPILAGDPMAPPCLMRATHLTLQLPKQGFSRLPAEDSSESCGQAPTTGWMRGSSGKVDFFVHADGPEGSGRYWRVKVGVGGERHSPPDRGICITTSTLGWRTLLRYKGGALSWVDDVDGDGNAEFILWESFPLHADASLAEYALVAWVYRPVSSEALEIDWNLSRRLARAIADEYRAPLDTVRPYAGKLRVEAAAALDAFANEQCTGVHQGTSADAAK